MGLLWKISAALAVVFAVVWLAYVEPFGSRGEAVGPVGAAMGGNPPGEDQPEESRVPQWSERSFEPSAAVDSSPLLEHGFVTVEICQHGSELEALRTRIRWLEVELVACNATAVDVPLGRWILSLPAAQRPDARTLHLMSEYLEPYPLVPLPDEWLWLAERTRLDDWDDWGPTIDEAIILFLGADRIAREVSPDALAVLRDEWSEEGYFN